MNSEKPSNKPKEHVHGPHCQHDHDHGKVAPIVNLAPKIGRNDPCPCNSGKKYKKCCAGVSND